MNHNNWPVWATEAIIIEPYNPKWPSDATKLIKELKGLHNFGSTLFEHIGSTAVPGLSAKPIIDLIGPISNFDDLNIIAECLKVNDWHLIPPDLDQREYRRTFVKVIDNKRFAHLHLVLNGSNELKHHIKFRNILIQYPLLANDYAQLKIDLAKEYKDDREKYSESKTDFIKTALQKYLS
jgi:GrpB-like predicted nucleotidyltransferase (UPF0157 family)